MALVAKSASGLNILYVGNLPPHRDGGAIFGAQLLEGLAEQGHTIRALAPTTAEALEMGDPCGDRGIEVTRYLVPYFELEPNAPSSDEYRLLQGRRIREALSSLIRSDRPDLIVAGRETFAWDVPDVARAHSVPCVLILQGTTTAGVVSGTYTRARELLEHYCKADLIVVPARHMARLLDPTPRRKVAVIPNSVDLLLFRPRPKPETLLRELAIPEGDVVVAHLSNLKAVKRPLDVVDSAERALAENPRLTYVIIGDGPCRQSMQERCAEHRVSERFRFTGWVDHREVPDYLNLADIVVMPSEFEAQAKAYLETQACARVLVASDVAGAREVVADGETGLLFKAGDPDDLASRTLLAAGDATLRADIGHAAREAVMAHSREGWVAAYAAALERVAVRRHRR